MKNHLNIIILTALLSIYSCTSEKKEMEAGILIQKSINRHDPNNYWYNMSLQIHIQEPRLSNPLRYSIIKINHKDNSFELSRNRDNHISIHQVDEKGISKTLLDGVIITDSTLITKYRLQPERNHHYQKFYQQLIGLPMSLNDNTVDTFGTVSPTVFNKIDSYKIELILKEAIFSRYWNIYISQKDHTFLGMEIVFPDDPTKGERLYFSGEINIDGVKIPRVRHWHEYETDEYSGSDIIVKQLESSK